MKTRYILFAAAMTFALLSAAPSAQASEHFDSTFVQETLPAQSASFDALDVARVDVEARDATQIATIEALDESRLISSTLATTDGYKQIADVRVLRDVDRTAQLSDGDTAITLHAMYGAIRGRSVSFPLIC